MVRPAQPDKRGRVPLWSVNEAPPSFRMGEARIRNNDSYLPITPMIAPMINSTPSQCAPSMIVSMGFRIG